MEKQNKDILEDLLSDAEFICMMDKKADNTADVIKNASIDGLRKQLSGINETLKYIDDSINLYEGIKTIFYGWNTPSNPEIQNTTDTLKAHRNIIEKIQRAFEKEILARENKKAEEKIKISKNDPKSYNQTEPTSESIYQKNVQNLLNAIASRLNTSQEWNAELSYSIKDNGGEILIKYKD